MRERERKIFRRMVRSPAFQCASQAHSQRSIMSHVSCFLHESPQYWMSSCWMNHLVTFVNSKRETQTAAASETQVKKNTRSLSLCLTLSRVSRFVLSVVSALATWNSLDSFSFLFFLFSLTIALSALSFHSPVTRALCNLILMLIQFRALR